MVLVQEAMHEYLTRKGAYSLVIQSQGSGDQEG